MSGGSASSTSRKTDSLVKSFLIRTVKSVVGILPFQLSNNKAGSLFDVVIGCSNTTEKIEDLSSSQRV